ncbi:MAG: inositol-3-phosphate synthase [Deltaproteobacteria bacterium]|nr:inositol-3-phosphate synthase [Deltaproteobacteria bacterium]
MTDIHVSVVGIGNCASSLIQGIHYYQNGNPDDTVGLMHWDLGGYRPGDIKVVGAFDIDQRKVGRDVGEAIFTPPNCTKRFYPDVGTLGVVVRMGKMLDGFSEHMQGYPADQTFIPAETREATRQEIVNTLRETKTDILLNYLPVGSETATRFYAECALEADVAFINNIPVFLASDPEWAKRFAKQNLPIVGDDIKSQLGATIVHRILTDLFKKRGVKLERTYQLNVGGNTDFLNMMNQTRLVSKRKSKTEAVQAVAAKRLEDNNIHIGPSDYIPWQKDNKICFIRMEGKLFGDVPMNLELRLSVEDSPNSAGVAIDAIRCVKLALDRGIGGVLEAPSAYFCKHPARQYTDDEAYRMIEAFINGEWNATEGGVQAAVHG